MNTLSYTYIDYLYTHSTYVHIYIEFTDTCIYIHANNHIYVNIFKRMSPCTAVCVP